MCEFGAIVPRRSTGRAVLKMIPMLEAMTPLAEDEAGDKKRVPDPWARTLQFPLRELLEALSQLL